MEPRTISSSRTFVMKLIFPTIWISLFGFGTAALWFASLRPTGGHPLPEGMKWVFLAIWLVGSTVILKYCAILMKVRLGGGVLLVSNYRKEISIPASEIVEVSENKWMNIRPVTIRLRNATEFGDRIVFMPKVNINWPWKDHPVLEELRKAARGEV